MTLFVVIELGAFGEHVSRVHLSRASAEAFLVDKNPHLYKLDERAQFSESESRAELFAVHDHDEGYEMHRFSRFESDYDRAMALAGKQGLVLHMIPEP